MKRFVLVIALCSVLTAFLPAGRTPADVAGVTGGDGGTVRPLDNRAIQLEKEFIRIQVHKDRAEFLIVYDFVNTTGQDQTVRMGFPERAAHADTERLQDFTVMDSDQPVATRLETGESQGRPGPAMNFHTFSLEFAPGEAKRVTNAYWVWSTEYRGLYSLEYFLHTGAGWKGPIKSVDVLVSLDPELVFPGPALKAAGLDNAPPDYVLDPETGQLSWHFTDLEPTTEHDLTLLYLQAGRPCDVVLTASSRQIVTDAAEPGHDPLLVLDGDPATAWVEGETGPGLGQWIMARFMEPGGYEVHRVGVLPGYAKGDLFRQYNRVKSATLHFSDGTTQKIELEDKQAMQFFEIDPIRTAFVKLVIDAVYPGDLFDDTCISEMEIHTSN